MPASFRAGRPSRPTAWNAPASSSKWSRATCWSSTPTCIATGGDDALSWLGGPDQTPVLLLADVTPGLIVEALSQGADHWLPRDLALSCPALLAATLQTAAHLADLRRRAKQAGETLADCRRQVSRLVSLLWEATPAEGRHGWFNQRHMLERLDEEVVRTQRHGGAFTVVLGEVQGGRREQAFDGRDATPGDAGRRRGCAGQAPLRRGRAVRAARLHAAAAGGDDRWARSAAVGGCSRCWKNRRRWKRRRCRRCRRVSGSQPSRRRRPRSRRCCARRRNGWTGPERRGRAGGGVALASAAPNYSVDADARPATLEPAYRNRLPDPPALRATMKPNAAVSAGPNAKPAVDEADLAPPST